MDDSEQFRKWQRWWGDVSDGDDVLVRWGDVKIPATIVNKRHAKNLVRVQYDDASENVIHKYHLLPIDDDI